MILQTPDPDDIRDRSAVPDSTMVDSPSPFIPITAVPVCPNCISENHTTYPATLGSIHPFCPYPVGIPHNFGDNGLVCIARIEPFFLHSTDEIAPRPARNFHGDLWMTE